MTNYVECCAMLALKLLNFDNYVFILEICTFNYIVGTNIKYLNFNSIFSS